MNRKGQAVPQSSELSISTRGLTRIAYNELLSGFPTYLGEDQNLVHGVSALLVHTMNM